MSQTVDHSMGLRPSAAARALLERSRRATTVPTGDVVLLDSGDPDFATPEPITRALHDAIEAGYTHYGEPFGDPELRSLVADVESHNAVAPIAPEQVLITHGASAGLGAAIAATVGPGDRVLIPEPTYSLYGDQVLLAGGEPCHVPTDATWHLDFDALHRTARDGARMIVLCHPCNPTGAVMRREELEAVARLAQEHDMLVLVDQAYDTIVADGVQFTSALAIDGLAERLIYCQTFSKRHAMTGWRIGYTIVPTALAGAIGKVHFTQHGPLNAAVQRAAIVASTLVPPPEWASEYERRREIVESGLDRVPGLTVPRSEGAFYFFIRYAQQIDSVTMRTRGLEAGVAVRAGSEFGDAGERCLRLSITSPRSDLAEGVRRLRALLAAA